MVSCKKCIHYDVCWQVKEEITGNPMHQNVKPCGHFKDKNDVAEVRHGKWEYKEGAAYCTACKRQTDPRNYGYPHCPLCGAPMDGKE